MATETEHCPICLQLYHYEATHCCVFCDERACSFCVMRVDSEWLCLLCKEQEGDRTRHVEG